MSHTYRRPFNPDGVQACFISFRCYGTWLHGDARGSVDRAGHNVWGTPLMPADPRRCARERKALRQSLILLDEGARTLVDQAIRQVCSHRHWILHALNVQDDHVHLVVTASEEPELVMNSLKSWATRRLRQEGRIPSGSRVWSRHGSTRWLWTQEQVGAACAYVIEGQPWPPEMGWNPE